MNKKTERKIEKSVRNIAEAMKNECGAPRSHCGTGAGAVYGLGLLGALYYYLTTAATLWIGVVGIVKAIFWPAVIVHAALKALGA